MAKSEHVTIIYQGVSVWNNWRDENINNIDLDDNLKLDLSFDGLSSIDLTNTNREQVNGR